MLRLVLTLGSRKWSLPRDDFEVFSAIDSIGVEVAVEGKDAVLLETFRGGDERRIGDVHRNVLVLAHEVPNTPPLIGGWFQEDWRSALVVVQPQTLIKWQKQAFRSYWRARSRRPGRPPIPRKTIDLIRQMNRENRTWGARRIASELMLKLGIRLSHRTVAKYMRTKRHRDGGQSWTTFLRNHSAQILACDFFTVPTLRFRLLRVLVILELSRRRILHVNVTERPNVAWTLQQFREALPWEHDYRFLIHDRDSLFSKPLDKSIGALGLEILRTPYQAPLANAHCERLIGTIRRECLDHLIILGEFQLRRLLNEWVPHYNRGRPHQSLGPDLPVSNDQKVEVDEARKGLRPNAQVTTRSVLGGLHHEYELVAA